MKIIERAKEWGNGAGVRVPRNWLGVEVEVRPMIPLAIKEIQEKIIEIANPYLANIQGIYITGSYARKEQTSTSDIDILVISDKKIKIPGREPYDIYIISRNEINKIVKYYPLLIISMIREAVPIINKSLLEDLRKIQLRSTYFKEYLESTKRALKIINGFLEGYEDSDIATGSLIYPIILRLRGLYLVEALLKNKEYRVSKMKNDIEGLGIKMNKVEEIYKIYQVKRDTKKNLNSWVTIGEIKKIYSLVLKKYKETMRWLKEK